MHGLALFIWKFYTVRWKARRSIGCSSDCKEVQFSTLARDLHFLELQTSKDLHLFELQHSLQINRCRLLCNYDFKQQLFFFHLGYTKILRADD